MKRLPARFGRGGAGPWASRRCCSVFLDLNAPLHPGAIRHYREFGLEIPKLGWRNPELLPAARFI